MSHAALIRVFAVAACALCVGVVVLGAYVRLSDAGLGCPDWPGCYGHLTTLGAAADTGEQSRTLTIARRSGRPFQPGKAWREMLHRYAAGTLAALILCLATMSVAWRRERYVPLALACGLAGIVLLQAAFGMLTVTWRLMPLIVTLHLLFGLTTLSLLWWLVLGRARARGGPWRPRAPAPAPPGGHEPRPARVLAAIGLGALVLQIALGGWTSSNYAALACPDVPTCQGQWWPRTDFRAGYTLSRGIELDAAGGMGSAALTAIQLTHRLGALIASLTLLAAAGVTLSRATAAAPRRAALIVAALLALQLSIGITMVIRGFPLWLATAHNAGAALLLLATLGLQHFLEP